MKKTLLVTLCAGLIFLGIGFMVYQHVRITALERTVAEVQIGALHQAAEEADALALSLEKALLAADPAQAATLLSSIAVQSEAAARSLALLPMNTSAMTCINQLSGSAEAMLPQVVRAGGLTEAQLRQLEKHLALCTQLCGQLALLDDPVDFATLTLDALPAAPAPATAKGLPLGDITQEEALSIARSVVGDERIRSVTAAPGTTGTLAAYGVTVQTEDVQLNLEITRQGGKPLWMMPETASFPVEQSVQTCLDSASAFLDAHDFAAMEHVHHQVYDGLCVLSFAPVQEGVLLYPDVVRVQVRMDTAQVVGLEAHSYWMNHTARALPSPSLTQEAALALLGHPAERGQLCVIPLEVGEKLCYEFTLRHEGESYLIYVDAQSGQEWQLLKTIPIENGSLTA